MSNLTVLGTHHYVDLELLSEAPVVVDAGACVGQFTRNVLKVRPKAEMHLIEASPLNYARLLKEEIGHPVRMVNAALVGYDNGPIEFVEYISGSKGKMKKGHVVGVKKDDDPRYTIRTIAVQAMAIERFLPCDFIKMDIEGAEYGVLDRMVTLDKVLLPKQLTVELHETTPCRLDDAIAVLKGMGYGVKDCGPERSTYRVLWAGMQNV